MLASVIILNWNGLAEVLSMTTCVVKTSSLASVMAGLPSEIWSPPMLSGIV